MAVFVPLWDCTHDTDITHPETRYLLAAVRKKLVERDGRKVEDVLEEIARRTQPTALRRVAESRAPYTPKPISSIPKGKENPDVSHF